jgi:hypothetical protein
MELFEPRIVVLRASKRKALQFLAISLGFTAMGVLMIRDGAGLKGWFFASFFGLAVVVFLASLWPGASYLKLTPTGVECCSLFRRWFYPWETVSDFGVGHISGYKMVVFSRHCHSYVRLPAFNRWLWGVTDALPDTYGLKHEELAELLNKWRRRALQ